MAPMLILVLVIYGLNVVTLGKAFEPSDIPGPDAQPAVMRIGALIANGYYGIVVHSAKSDDWFSNTSDTNVVITTVIESVGCVPSFIDMFTDTWDSVHRSSSQYVPSTAIIGSAREYG